MSIVPQPHKIVNQLHLLIQAFVSSSKLPGPCYMHQQQKLGKLMPRELSGFPPIQRVAGAWEGFCREGGPARPCKAQGAGQLVGGLTPGFSITSGGCFRQKWLVSSAGLSRASFRFTAAREAREKEDLQQMGTFPSSHPTVSWLHEQSSGTHWLPDSWL